MSDSSVVGTGLLAYIPRGAPFAEWCEGLAVEKREWDAEVDRWSRREVYMFDERNV